MDNKKFLELNNFKFTPLRIGIKKTVEWYIKNYKKTNEHSKINNTA